MKKSILIPIAILFISSTAFAYDMTYVRTVKAHSTLPVAVDLPAGKSVTEVWANNGAILSCAFIDKGANKVSLEQKSVTRCNGEANLSVPEQMLVNVSNDNDNDVSIKVWSHSPNTEFEKM